MKKSFIVYHEISDVLSLMTDAQAGELFKALVSHSRGETYTISDPGVSFAFAAIRPRIDSDAEYYRAKCEKNKESGKKGGRPNEKRTVILETERSEEKANGFFNNPLDIDIDSDSDIDVNIKDTPLPPQGEVRAVKPKRERKPASSIPFADAFAEFWEAYPRKTAKANAEKAWAKLAKASALPDMDTLLAAIGNQAESQDWAREDYRFCPHPATWLNGKRWEDTPAAAVQHNAATLQKYRDWASGYATKLAALLGVTSEESSDVLDAGAKLLAEYIAPDGFSEDEMARLIGWILAKPERAQHVPSLAALADEVPGWGMVMTWASNGSKGLDVGNDPRMWRKAANG